MFDFEKLHKNHKLAFLDGMLCGIAVAVMARQFYNDYREMRENKALMEESKRAKATPNQ